MSNKWGRNETRAYSAGFLGGSRPVCLNPDEMVHKELESSQLGKRETIY